MLLSLKDITSNLIKCSSSATEGTKFSDKFKWYLDGRKLQNIFNQTSGDLVVCATPGDETNANGYKLYSRMAEYSDIHTLANFANNFKELNDFFSDNNEIIIFSILSLKNDQGKIFVSIDGEDGKEKLLSNEDVFKLINTTSEVGKNFDAMMGLCYTAPRYTVLGYKYFDNKNEMFRYKFICKPNPAMYRYQKSEEAK